ncbi:MAG: AMP-binding protein, partial [Terriglobales bacterium]
LDLACYKIGAEIVRRVKAVALQGFEHQLLPFEHLLNSLGLDRDNSRIALVPVMIRHQNFFQEEGKDRESAAQSHPERTAQEAADPGGNPWDSSVPQIARSELDFQFFGEGGRLEAVVEYATDLFDAATVERMLEHQQSVLEELVAEPERKLSRFALLSEAEQRRLAEWNATEREYGERAGVVELFERQVELGAGRMACLSEEESVSYGELNARANRVAARLRELGVGPEVLVGLYLERSPDFVAAMLGVFKAGGAYVPLDPRHPADYTRTIMGDARLGIVVARQERAEAVTGQGAAVLELESLGEADPGNPTRVGRPEHLAYIMYTSGSTGRPKGAMVAHRQILNWLHALWERIPFGEDEVVAQTTVAVFSMSMKEFLGGLLRGRPQALIGDETVRDAEKLAEALQRWKVTRLSVVPTHLQALMATLGEKMQALSALRICITGGEPLTRALRAEVHLKLPWVTLWFAYGCTELNDTTYCRPEEQEGGGDFVPIGRPIANLKAYVLDGKLRRVPVGVA